MDATEKEIDIEFIQEDVSELIGDCREGTERIKKIVEDLKHFAHPGEDKMTETDINKGLESTLNVVNNELKYKATVSKEFGDLPFVSGFPQQLNQVFMNILVNAAQAIEKSGEINISSPIWWTTWLKSASATPAAASPRKTSPGYSIRSSPPKMWARAPDWE